jgi:Leucine rich repeat
MLVHILALIVAAPLWCGATSVVCPATCECSETFEELLSIACPGMSALMLPNETLQVDCVGRAAAVQLPAAPEVSLTNCAPDAFARADTRTLFLRNLSTTGPVRVGAWPSLLKLDVSNNKLEILSTRFLSGLYSLTQLDLSKCQLHYLYPFCFHGFTLLKVPKSFLFLSKIRDL